MIACPDCNKTFKTPQALAGHRRFKHQVPGKLRWIPGPGSHLITEGEFAKVLMDALKSNVEVQESLRSYIDFNVDGLKHLTELNHQQGDDNSKQLEEFTDKLVDLANIVNSHIEWVKKQIAEQKATIEKQQASIDELIAANTDLAEVVNDLVARKYGTEEART
jgi:hypothetical protein